MDEKTIHLLKIRLRINAKHYGGLAAIFALFIGAAFLSDLRIETNATQHPREIQEGIPEENSGEKHLPPQFFQGNPPLSAMKSSEQLNNVSE